MPFWGYLMRPTTCGGLSITWATAWFTSNLFHLQPIIGRGCEKHFSNTNRVFQWKGQGIQWMRGLVRSSTRKAIEFSEEVRAIRWAAGLWKLKSCCPHPLPKNQAPTLEHLWDEDCWPAIQDELHILRQQGGRISGASLTSSGASWPLLSLYPSA